MLKTKTTKTKSASKESRLADFEKVNDKIFFKEMRYQDVTDKMKEKFQSFKQDGITVVIVDGKRHRPYLAPGQDPYEVRKKTTAVLKIKHANNAKGTTKKSSSVEVGKTISI